MRARAAASIALAALLATGMAGCNFVTTQATTFRYDPSDGRSADVGDLQLRNILAVTEDGADANLVLIGVNRSSDPIDLIAQVGEGADRTAVSVTLEPGSNRIGYGELGQLLFSDIDAPAGSLLDVYFQYGDEAGRQVPVPVVDGELPEYEDLLPMPIPTPSGTPSDEPEA
ncbi:hypothetical protein [Homoserinibacter sp. YIM 151385]|uniref:hypothetical protein n=1 Tax=Homoserinibacter sp. YIM 151385 TaxID=2985506 RepID=UPI0022F0F9D0|nr:hypothetical protein [Homoserinibacter sp. YIM 151385]WBU37840.1 hypothetical protein OF852_13110 [Homoserinibacter sp. YIM 151385]